MAETQEAPFTEADVQSFAAKLQEFGATLTEAEQAVLGAILAPIVSDDEVSGYALKTYTYGISFTQYFSVNLGTGAYGAPVYHPAPYSPPPPTPHVPELTYVDGIAYNPNA